MQSSVAVYTSERRIIPKKWRAREHRRGKRVYSRRGGIAQSVRGRLPPRAISATYIYEIWAKIEGSRARSAALDRPRASDSRRSCFRRPAFPLFLSLSRAEFRYIPAGSTRRAMAALSIYTRAPYARAGEIVAPDRLVKVVGGPEKRLIR